MNHERDLQLSVGYFTNPRAERQAVLRRCV